MVLNGIKSELECESQSLGGQKVNFKYWGRKVHFSLENGTSFSIENLGTYISICHNFKNWVSFSHHFWITQLML